MAKPKILNESSLVGQDTRLPHYKQFLGKTDAWDDGRSYHQDVNLIKYPDTENTVPTFYGDCVTCISEILERRLL